MMPPKSYRNRSILREAMHHSCQWCWVNDGTVVAAHSNQQRHGKGFGIKAHDLPAYLCHQCHTMVDQDTTPAWLRKAIWETAFVRSVELYRHLLDDEGRRLVAKMLLEIDGE